MDTVDKSTRDLIEVVVLFAGLVMLCLILRSVYRFAARRGWVHPEDYRPNTTAFGNAMLSVQSLFEPSKKHLLEQKTTRRRRESNAGDPPEPPHHAVE